MSPPMSFVLRILKTPPPFIPTYRTTWALTDFLAIFGLSPKWIMSTAKRGIILDYHKGVRILRLGAIHFSYTFIREGPVPPAGSGSRSCMCWPRRHCSIQNASNKPAGKFYKWAASHSASRWKTPGSEQIAWRVLVPKGLPSQCPENLDGQSQSAMSVMTCQPSHPHNPKA